MDDNNQILKSIDQIRYRSTHKIVFLLSLISYYEKHLGCKNTFPLDHELETEFIETWTRLHKENPPHNAIEYPYYHLQNDRFWHISIKQGCEAVYESYKDSRGDRSRLTKRKLQETVQHGYLNEDFFKCLENNNCRKKLERFLLEKFNSLLFTDAENTDFTVLDVTSEEMVAPNPFVAYLNSLHSLDAGNENALAESQACNPEFSRIHVAHSLVKPIVEQLRRNSGKSVILTGHAGDGKSTLALSVYKELKGLDDKDYLLKPLQPREDIRLPDGVFLAIIKDLSEWSAEQRDALMEDITQHGLKVLLISNTGALLETFCSYAERHRLEGRADLRPRVLEALDADSESIEFGGANFRLYNLALHDNLGLAQQVFTRMLAPENWEDCAGQACRAQCPIYRNMRLFREQGGLAQDRVFLAYRRMHEYGTRLTMRQFTAHLAYMLTAGLEHSDIRSIAAQAERPLISDYMFYNRFFGDNGRGGDGAAGQMPVILAVRSHGFGERPCPAMERHLWLLTHHDLFHTGLPLIEDEFQRLRHHGARLGDCDWGTRLTPDQAREQTRRLLYFLYRDEDAGRQRSFLQDFLGSLAILRWCEWQDPEVHLSLEDESRFKQRIFHVLQEQFTGVRLAEEGGPGHSQLYITLSRRRQDIRQSAQVVLAQIDFLRSFKLCLVDSGSPSHRRDLALVGQGWLSDIFLGLNLPFLDYVLARNHGQVGEALQAAYSNRLERLKADLIERCRSENEDEMILVRLRTNYTFRRQHFKVAQGQLEVSNA